MANARKIPESLDNLNMPNKKFYKAEEGALLFSVGVTAFKRLAKEAEAKYKIGKTALYNVEKINEYLETFREY